MKRLALAAICCTGLYCSVASGAEFYLAQPSSTPSSTRPFAKTRFPALWFWLATRAKSSTGRLTVSRALLPVKEAMAADTIFDIASLTKIVATTSGMMKLVEQGRVKIDDPVTAYLPEFQRGVSPITVRDLMTHFSGLRPDLDIDPPWGGYDGTGYDTGIRKALADKPAGPPESKIRLQRH